MAKDSLREYLQSSVEAYNLSGTPSPSPVYRETVDDCEQIDAPRILASGRKSQLDLGIDVKRIFDAFIGEISHKYGPQRAERFITWVKVGYIEQFHSDHRRMIKWDRRILSSRIFTYRHTNPLKNGQGL